MRIVVSRIWNSDRDPYLIAAHDLDLADPSYADAIDYHELSDLYRTGAAGGTGFREETVTQTELRELIANGEHSGVEFTSDVIDKNRLAEELVAFANLQGGRVLLGVDHNGSVLGLTRVDPLAGTEEDDEGEHTYQRLEEWVMQACRDKVRPEIVPYFEIMRSMREHNGTDPELIEEDENFTLRLWKTAPV